MSDPFKDKITKALELDVHRVKAITVKFSDSDIPLVTVELYPPLNEANFEWISELEHYRLVPDLTQA